MRIAVIGAGISGLTAAAGLQRCGHEVQVYERHPELRAAGAGLTLFANSFAALDALDLGDAVRAVSNSKIAELRSGQRTPQGKWLLSVPARSAGALHSVHRAELHRALVEQLKPDSVRLATRAAVSASGGSTIQVGGQAESFDLVVVADGIRSENRKFLGLDPGLRYAGYTVWRGVTSTTPFADDVIGETWGRGRVFGIVPLRDGRVYWYATLTAPANSRFPDEHAAVSEVFAGWHAPVPACIAATAPSEVIRHDIYDLAAPLTTFRHNRTVLVGDAAHAMAPNLGQGAGQGIEDAATLALLLDGARLTDLPRLLAQYDDARVARSRSLWRQSRLAGQVSQQPNGLFIAARNTAMRVVPGSLAGLMRRHMHTWEPPGR